MCHGPAADPVGAAGPASSSCTPLTYRQVVGQTRDVLVTAFATGSALIVLPLLVERSKELLRQSALSTADTEATVEVIVPAFTSFPKIGTLFPMSFVLFAGWFAGRYRSPQRSIPSSR